MIRIAAFAACPLLLGACAAGPAVDLELEEQAVRARGEALMQVENARDLETALAFYAPDAVIQAPAQPAVIGQEALRAQYARAHAPGAPQVEGAFTSRVITVAASGDVAWEWGTANTTVAVSEGVMVMSSKQMIIWKKLNGEWVIAALSYSGDEPPPGRPALP